MLVDEPAGGGAWGRLESVVEERGDERLPPKPVAKPTVPSVASISTKKDPNTLMPQLVREARYFSHCEQGVEMGESMSLAGSVSQWVRRVSTAVRTNGRP